MISRIFSHRIGVPVILSLISLILFTGLRSVLLIQSFPDLPHETITLLVIYAQGLLYDVVVCIWAFAPLAIVLEIMPERVYHTVVHRHLMFALAAGLFFGIGFIMVAEWLFWQEFSARFNFIAVDYLIYRREVAGNISESYPLVAILSALVIVALIKLYWVRGGLRRALEQRTPPRQRVVSAISAALLFVGAFWFNGDMFAPLSANTYVDELAHNGLFQFFYAFRHNQLDYERYYSVEDPATASELLRAQVLLPGERFTGSELFDVTRQVSPPEAERKLNVILITVESLSADYLSAFGNSENLTPNLDRLAKEGLLFTRYYATGNRTVRGLEAVTLGIPPTPGNSVIRRPDNANLFSLGSVFSAKGYDVKFLYGGYGYFDNMNEFFASNGYDVIDRALLAQDEQGFANVWGVADEYLYLRALREADRSHAAGKPFFSLLMTTSNHRPYTFPEGRIDAPQKKRASVVRYTDWAIAHFIEEAQKHSWFGDTVFVIGADHCAGSAGKNAVPLLRYHIPLIVYAPEHVAPRLINQVTSQMDLPPTVLGLLNMHYTSRFYGRDILRTPPDQGRALVATYQRVALYEKDRLTVLSPRRADEIHIDPLGSDIVQPLAFDKAAGARTIAWYQGASWALKHGLLSALPPSTHTSTVVAKKSRPRNSGS
ncbi:LTA synthase family protein [Methylocaldum sp.]|uniref:LTA synthase family protein n=1 Tax=Methylocaldum sp. TaxID=1969727 RepID=UPI002D36D49F|nr:LTA synthase family protein [Methylocaldum sp.]HYE35442.1 LTA synthase family protein [Methylocaldum sp.]